MHFRALNGRIEALMSENGNRRPACFGGSSGSRGRSPHHTGSRGRSPHPERSWATGSTNALRSAAAFTLVELLAVIAIMALIAAMVGPTVTQFRKGDAIKAATRQMLDAVARARQLAISEHTTVYLVFIPTNFWGPDPDTFVNGLTPSERVAVSNLLDKQLTGYTFLSLRSIGDQPGKSTPRYLSAWQTLPESSFIPPWKFTTTLPRTYIYRITDPITRQFYDVGGFLRTNAFPFPSEEAAYSGTPMPVWLPYIAFNYLGQLTSGDGQLLGYDEIIPLAHGSVAVALDRNRVPIMSTNVAVKESPLWNSTNSFNLIHIDRLTGRARLERQEVQ